MENEDLMAQEIALLCEPNHPGAFRDATKTVRADESEARVCARKSVSAEEKAKLKSPVYCCVCCYSTLRQISSCSV